MARKRAPVPIDHAPIDDDDPDDDRESFGGWIESLRDPQFASVSWDLYRVNPNGAPIPAGFGRTPGNYLATFGSDLQPATIQERFGGGFYRLVGRRDTGTIATTISFSLEGPSKLPDGSPPGVPMVPPYSSSGPAAPSRMNAAPIDAGDRLGIALAAIDSRLQQIEQRKGADVMSRLVETVLVPVVQRMLQPPPPPVSPEKIIETTSAAFIRGLDVGAHSERGGGDSVIDVIRELAGTAIQAYAQRAAARPAAAPAVAAPAPAPIDAGPIPPRPAEPVIAFPTPLEQGGVVSLESLGARWGAMIAGPLVRAMQLGRDPADIADLAEAWMPDAELELLASSTPDAVIAAFPADVRAAHSILTTPAGISYVAAVLQALREPDSVG